jgi:hypothetical protein
VGVRIVETWQHRGTPKVDDPRARAFQPHQLGPSDRDDLPTRSRDMTVRLQPAPAKRSYASARQDQVCFHARLM